MSKQKGIKKLLFFVVFFVVAVLFLSLCWKKRIGIYNTFMKLTGQESNYEVLVNLKKDHYGYYKQELKVTMDREDNAKIQENDSASDDLLWWKQPLRSINSFRVNRSRGTPGKSLW